ncbi:MAG: NAD(P)-dependent oxidoreductase [Ferruginibacter sp.]
MVSTTKILITGATGALGRELVPFLLKHLQCEILTINRSVERAESSLQSHLGLRHTTINDLKDIQSFAPEVVLHLASFVTSALDLENGIKLVEANITYGIRLMDAISQCSSVRLFLNFGTFAEYRSGTDHTENAYLYSASKTAFRAFAEFYAQTNGFNLVHVVPYTIYGTQDERKKILDYIFDGFHSEKPVKMTPGNQVLDFIHVMDVCKCLEQIISYPAIEKYNFQDIYLGTGTGHSIREVASLMGELLQKQPNILWGGLPYRDRDVALAIANTEKLVELDCLPVITLKEGLIKYLKTKH